MEPGKGEGGRTMPETGITGEALRQWRLGCSLSVRQMAVLLQEHSHDPLPPAKNLMLNINAWERGDHAPNEAYRLLYRQVFPGLGHMPPPARIAMYASPVDAAEAAKAVLADLAKTFTPAEVEWLAARKIAAGSDPARVWALQETYRDLRKKADDTAALLAALTSEGGRAGDARAG